MEGHTMTTMALSDGRWFDLADATLWESRGQSLIVSTLYLIGGQWALHDATLATLLNTPAVLIDATAALEWIVLNGHPVPAELQSLAETTRLR